ncbi:MAG: SIS domain-containing protein [Treponema sp.]|jgi:D-arabinose 5-phosphate isomerase GutQ|nr:SIS domain-containing protein [Treponema sp.]
MKEPAWEQARAAFTIEAGALMEMAETVDKAAFSRAVELLALAPRIAASGCGHSGIACMHFAHLMCCIERPARFIPPSEALHGGLGFIQRGDVMLLASRGGRTAELLPIPAICKKKGAAVIAVTENLSSPMALEADLTLKITVPREADPGNTQGTTSFTVLSVLFDALQTALIVKTAYRDEQFALIHPGGAVGERLNRPKP